MSKKKTLRLMGRSGFTLIELMTTVAIIGILAAIAIPNYIKYQRKARQAEAKVMLGSIFTGEYSNLTDTSSGGGFSSCISALGFEPAGTTYYAVGFSDAVAALATCNVARGGTTNAGKTAGANSCLGHKWTQVAGTANYRITNECAAGNTQTRYDAFQAAEGGVPTGEADIAHAAPQIGFTTKWQFTAAAAGNIGGSQTDEWNVDESKSIFQVQDGVR